jgi:hypothetical protein
MRKLAVLPAAAALLASSNAFAAIGYNYAQGYFHLADVQQGDGLMNGSGINLQASTRVWSNLFAFGSYASDKYSARLYEGDDHFEIQLEPVEAGLGLHLPIGIATDVVVAGTLQRVHLRMSNAGEPLLSEKFNGWGATLAFRGWFADDIQWDIGATYGKVGDLQTVIRYTAGGRYYFRTSFSAGLYVGGSKYDDDTLDMNEHNVGVVIRYDFGLR